MSDRVMGVNLATTDGQVVMFPNGKKFSANDVFLGAVLLDFIEVSADGTAKLNGSLTIYDGIVLATGRNHIGGTAGVSPVDQWRCIASATAVSENDRLEPFVLGAPGAEVTALRKLAQIERLYVDPATGGPQFVRFKYDRMFVPGIAVHVTQAAATNLNVKIGYTPLASGSARRRISGYGRTGTTKALVPMRTNIPL